MAIAAYLKEIMLSPDSSVIRKMFEEGSVLKQKYGADAVFDFSLGNPNRFNVSHLRILQEFMDIC